MGLSSFLADQIIYDIHHYRQASNISRTLVGNELVDHSGTCRRCSNYIFILDFTTGFNGLGKGNCKTRRESFKFCDLVRPLLYIVNAMDMESR